MAPDPSFVVQHHLATADHYDVRLEIDGVLVSWAVPKGPSTDPADHRLAIRTDDHELSHATYEGRTAPERGVLVWDRGTFANTSHIRGAGVPAAVGLERGHLSFRLDGAKLQGGFALIRTAGYGDARHESWLLTKKVDEFADPGFDPVRTRPESVLSGRTFAEILAVDDDAAPAGGRVP